MPTFAKRGNILKMALLIGLVSCGQHRQIAAIANTKKIAADSSSINQPSNTYKNISEVVSSEKTSIWRYGKMDESSRFHFSQVSDTLLIEYYPECWGSYLIKVNNDTIIAYWNGNIDTKYNFPLLKVINNQKLKRGAPFLAFTLANDSSLDVIYLDKELINKINAADTTLTFLPNRLMAEYVPSDF